MAFGFFKVIKGLVAKRENTLTADTLTIQPNGTASTDTTLQSSQTVNRTITLPDATTTLVGTNATQTLTNKTIDADANTITNIENADIKAGAAIAKNKLAAGTADRVSVTDASGFLVESTVTTADLNEIAGLAGLEIVTTAAAQTLTNKTIDADLNTLSNIENADIKAAAAIDATKLADGTVSNTELQYINSLTSNAQTQLDAKVDESLYSAKGSILAATAAATPADLPIGTDGQVLTADSAEASGLKWAPAGTASPLTTKGDLYTYDTDNARLGVGTDGQILTADSAEATGLKWAAAPATGANTTLSNLTSPTAINQNLLPGSDDALAVGSSTFRYNNVHTQSVTNTGAALTLTSTTGKVILAGTAVDMPAASSDPAGVGQSDEYYNTGLTKTKTYDGTQWRIQATKDENSFIPNGFAESSTTGFAVYADAAGAAPVDGTGGSANVTITTSGTAPLSGQNSFILTKDAANRQGQGWSYDFTIDNASKSKVLQIQFDSIVNSGTFAAGGAGVDSDITVWVYDITNSALIQPTTYKIFGASSTTPDKFISNFQSSANSTSYRLIFHCSTTSASAFGLKVDNILVSPTTISYGTPITDWVDTGTITINATTSNPTKGVTNADKTLVRRVGGDLQIQMGYRQTSAGSAGSGDYIFRIPSTYQIDSTKIPFYTNVEGGGGFTMPAAKGSFLAADNSTALGGMCVPYDSTGFRLFGYDSGSANVLGSGAYGLGSTNMCYTIDVFLPIAGWSAQVQSSDINDQRIVVARAKATASRNPSPTVPFNFDSVDFDTHAAITTGASWKFTAPITGYYEVSSAWEDTGAGKRAEVYKNDSLFAALGSSAAANFVGTGSTIVQLNAGDYIDIRFAVSSGTTSATSQNNYFIISRVANPASITSTETVLADYAVSSGVSHAANAIMNYDSKVNDTHNAVTTGVGAWRFTAPVRGYYDVDVCLTAQGGATPILNLFKNGSFYRCLVTAFGAAATGAQNTGGTNLQLNAGDYIEMRVSSNSSTFTTSAANNGTGSTIANSNYITIKKIGI